MLNHLKVCEYVVQAVRDAARDDPAATSTSESVHLRNRNRARIETPHLGPMDTPASGSSSFSYPPDAIHNPNPPGIIFSAHSPLLQPPLFSASNPSSRSGSPAPILSPLFIPSPSASSFASGDGSISAASSQGLRGPFGRSSSGGYAPRSSSNLRPAEAIVWTKEQQESFEDAIGRLTASGGLPLSWVDNPEWLGLVDQFIPGATSPSRKSLTNRIIPTLVQGIRDDAIKRARGGYSTLQADGWTGENHRHLLAFMITTMRQVC